MNIIKCLSHDYQSPTAVVQELAPEGVLCQSQQTPTGFDESIMENVDRDVFEW